VYLFTSICPPDASTPFAMNTIVSEFATVQTKNAISHMTYRLTR
jgi:hypothetical protein